VVSAHHRRGSLGQPVQHGTASVQKEHSVGLGDKISNKAEDLKGHGKEAAGSATGDQASASLKDGVEKVKDAAGDIKDGLTK
jgi:uncharacterized protein YjbJ (UPF0337 family)